MKKTIAGDDSVVTGVAIGKEIQPLMGNTKLKRTTVYFTEDEWVAFADGADIAGLSFSNYVRSWMNLPPLKRGAPTGNFNRILGQLNPRPKAQSSARLTGNKR